MIRWRKPQSNYPYDFLSACKHRPSCPFGPVDLRIDKYTRQFLRISSCINHDIISVFRCPDTQSTFYFSIVNEFRIVFFRNWLRKSKILNGYGKCSLIRDFIITCLRNRKPVVRHCLHLIRKDQLPIISSRMDTIWKLYTASRILIDQCHNRLYMPPRNILLALCNLSDCFPYNMLLQHRSYFIQFCNRKCHRSAKGILILGCIALFHRLRMNIVITLCRILRQLADMLHCPVI